MKLHRRMINHILARLTDRVVAVSESVRRDIMRFDHVPEGRIAKSWEKLEPYVLYERERRNEPYYYQYAGKLAERCIQWRQKNLTDTTTKWVDYAL